MSQLQSRLMHHVYHLFIPWLDLIFMSSTPFNTCTSIMKLEIHAQLTFLSSPFDILLLFINCWHSDPLLFLWFEVGNSCPIDNLILPSWRTSDIHHLLTYQVLIHPSFFWFMGQLSCWKKTFQYICLLWYIYTLQKGWLPYFKHSCNLLSTKRFPALTTEIDRL